MRNHQCKYRAMTKSSILLVLPVPFVVSTDGALLFEKQACNGLRLWRQNFDSVTVAAPFKSGNDNSGDWMPLPVISGLEFVQLPYAYHPAVFFRKLSSTRKVLSGLISRSEYLQFAIGGLIGDWGTVACFEALRQRRPYSVWTDAVGSEMERIQAFTSGAIKPRIKAAAVYFPTKIVERHVIRKASLGLFHGNNTYSAYAKFCSVPRLVHDIHLGSEMVMTDRQLEAKRKGQAAKPLQICYIGRVEAIKGPGDWLEVLSTLKKSGASFAAVWFGGGSLLENMQSKVRDYGLQSEVRFAGPVDHAEAISAIRKSDVMLFCHKTPESPRCLIEALMSGTPIVGYDSPFASDIVSKHRGGVLVEPNDIAALATSLIALCGNKAKVSSLSVKARNDGAAFSDEKVFKHRSALIKEFL